MSKSFDPSQRPPKRLQETFQIFGMDDCTPATAIGQPEIAPIANFLIHAIMVDRQPGEVFWLERVSGGDGVEELIYPTVATGDRRPQDRFDLWMSDRVDLMSDRFDPMSRRFDRDLEVQRVCAGVRRVRRPRIRRGLIALIERYAGNDLLPSLIWTILDIIIAGATAAWLLLIALIIRQ